MMYPQPRIDTIPEKKLVGKCLKMSLSNNLTLQLWQSFMPRRKEINNAIGTDLYSLQVYNPGYFADFNPAAEFEKWALIEVVDFNNVPEGIEAFTLPEGLYAVFLYKGIASAAAPFFQYIFQTWLPNSEYILDDRPHFEILGGKYKNNEPSSEEEIWIPVRLKG